MRIDTDRLLVVAQALLGTCVLSVAVADPPAAPAASPAPATSSSVAPSATTAAPAANTPAAAAEKPAVTVSATPDAAQAAEEKRLIAAGYKPEMRNGTKYWCRSETEMGSHMSHKVCGTAAEIKGYAHDGQESVEQAQRRQINPTGH